MCAFFFFILARPFPPPKPVLLYFFSCSGNISCNAWEGKKGTTKKRKAEAKKNKSKQKKKLAKPGKARKKTGLCTTVGVQHNETVKDKEGSRTVVRLKS